MPDLTAMDEYFVHQIPEPLPRTAVDHPHWRESYFFVAHPPDGDGPVLIVAMAHYPSRGAMDVLLMGKPGDRNVFKRFDRPYDGDPHTTTVGPVAVRILEPYKKAHLKVDDYGEGYSLDLAFSARTQAYGLRRGTLEIDGETIWDQSHMIQSGRYDGSFTWQGQAVEVDGWWGQRDHSWGIRNHGRCPMWLWLAIQLPDGMLGVWHWERPDGSHVFTDGCWAPADGSAPVPVTAFSHDLTWTANGEAATFSARQPMAVQGLRGRVVFELEGGTKVGVEAEGTWAAPYGRLGGQHLMSVRTDDGREGNGVYELTGVDHHRYFPPT